MTFCKIVLVHPRDPNNIGAAARAMKNFGLSELIVVAPHPPTWEEITSAVKADEIIANAIVVTTLNEAIADCTMVIGTKDRTQFPLPKIAPLELPQFRNEKLALIFGSEKHGLTNEDLSRCHRVLEIPTQPDCPSMNLAQAVAICCYELRKGKSAGDSHQLSDLSTAGEIETALRLAVEALIMAGFMRENNQPTMTLELRRSLLKMNLTSRETTLLCGALRQFKWKMGNAETPQK